MIHLKEIGFKRILLSPILVLSFMTAICQQETYFDDTFESRLFELKCSCAGEDKSKSIELFKIIENKLFLSQKIEFINCYKNIKSTKSAIRMLNKHLLLESYVDFVEIEQILDMEIKVHKQYNRLKHFYIQRNDKIYQDTLMKDLLSYYEVDQKNSLILLDSIVNKYGVESERGQVILMEVMESNSTSLNFVLSSKFCDKLLTYNIDNNFILYKAYFNIIQHSSNYTDLEQTIRCFDTIKAKAKNSRSEIFISRILMYLNDRLHLDTKGYQLYGTQYEKVGLEFVPNTIQNIRLADEVRISNGFLTVEHEYYIKNKNVLK